MVHLNPKGVNVLLTHYPSTIELNRYCPVQRLFSFIKRNKYIFCKSFPWELQITLMQNLILSYHWYADLYTHYWYMACLFCVIQRLITVNTFHPLVHHSNKHFVNSKLFDTLIWLFLYLVIIVCLYMSICDNIFVLFQNMKPSLSYCIKAIIHLIYMPKLLHSCIGHPMCYLYSHYHLQTKQNINLITVQSCTVIMMYEDQWPKILFFQFIHKSVYKVLLFSVHVNVYFKLFFMKLIIIFLSDNHIHINLFLSKQIWWIKILLFD